MSGKGVSLKSGRTQFTWVKILEQLCEGASGSGAGSKVAVGPWNAILAGVSSSVWEGVILVLLSHLSDH